MPPGDAATDAGRVQWDKPPPGDGSAAFFMVPQIVVHLTVVVLSTKAMMMMVPSGVNPVTQIMILAAALAAYFKNWRAPATEATIPRAAREGKFQDADYDDPCRWTFLPSDGIHRTNRYEPQVMEYDSATVKLCILHRPTHAPWLEASGEYPYSWHLAGRKRMWESRFQFRFKEVPRGQMFVGLELGSYVAVSGFARWVQQALVVAIRNVVGDFYHSLGDDPDKTEGELELPMFVMPLWAFDQFVVSEPGEEPDLGGDLEGLGMRRTDGLSNFVKEMKHIQSNISVNKVYTFCFWGISRFLDVAQWKICGTGFPMSFNELCGGPPVYLAVYELLPAADSEHRHLMSRKRYCCRYALWTQACPPSADALEPLVGRVNAEEASHHSRAPWWDFSSLLQCCSMRPGRGPRPVS